MGEALRVQWIGFHFFFSFELAYLRMPKKPVWAEPRRLVASCHKNLLLSALSLCKVVPHGLE